MWGVQIRALSIAQITKYRLFLKLEFFCKPFKNRCEIQG